MTSRIAEGSIRSSLARRHAALKRALALRLGLRAAAACAAVVTVAVLIGAWAPFGVGGAWTRLVLLAPQAVQRSWRTLFDPAAASPPIVLTVEPGSVKVSPGASLTVYAHVSGTERAPRLMRAGQKPLLGVPDGRVERARLWRFDLAQLTKEQDYRVRVAAVESPRYHIALAGEPVPVSFEVEYRAPDYARLPVQRGSALRGDLSALRGTRAHIEVTFDRDLTRLEAAVPGAAAASWNRLTARRCQGEILVNREGDYELHAVASAGEGRFRYRIQP